MLVEGMFHVESIEQVESGLGTLKKTGMDHYISMQSYI